MAILTVGTEGQYATLNAAVAASHDGDTIYVAAGTYVNDFSIIRTKVSIIGVGGMASFVATIPPTNGKAILTTNTDVTIDHLEFSGAQVSDHNGAGIRYQGGNLTITNSYFHDNQDGILGADVAGTTITIDHSEFASNGYGDGKAHDIYIGHVGTLSVTNSYIHDADYGHEIKSRADYTLVENNRIFDNSSPTSYSVDIPYGGVAVIKNNIIQQGPNDQNNIIISFEEGPTNYPNSSIDITGNTIVNQFARASNGVALAGNDPATISDNNIYGLLPSRLIYGDGPVTLSNNNFLTTAPTLDTTTHPWEASPSDHLASVFWQNTDGTAAIWVLGGVTQTNGAILGNPGSDWHLVDTGDFNGDGKADIVWQNNNGQADVWTMNGVTPVAAEFVGSDPGSDWHVKAAADFNGDGKADILWQNDNGQADIWTMNGFTPVLANFVGTDPGSDWHIKAAADFNGDGKADILWQNDNGQADIWIMNGATPIQSEFVGTNPGSDWHIKAAADFNGDGKADILWQNDNGQADVWTMDGVTPVEAEFVGSNPGADWHVVGAADFNSDGKADILWQNDNGQAAIWTMNGFTPTSSTMVGNNPGSSWHVITAGS